MAKKHYEILITHKEGACPPLPEGLQYFPVSEYTSWTCPAHLVFSEPCPIWKVRQIIEGQLFYVQGIQRISLYYGGERKVNDCYERDAFITRKWNHVY